MFLLLLPVCVYVAFSVKSVFSDHPTQDSVLSPHVCFIDFWAYQKLGSCKQYMYFKRRSHFLPYCLHLFGYVWCVNSSLCRRVRAYFRTSQACHLIFAFAVFFLKYFDLWTWQEVWIYFHCDCKCVCLWLVWLYQLCLCDLCFLCFFFFLSSLLWVWSWRLLLDLHSLSLLLLLSLSDSFFSLFLFFTFFC